MEKLHKLLASLLSLTLVISMTFVSSVAADNSDTGSGETTVEETASGTVLVEVEEEVEAVEVTTTSNEESKEDVDENNEEEIDNDLYDENDVDTTEKEIDDSSEEINDAADGLESTDEDEITDAIETIEDEVQNIEEELIDAEKGGVNVQAPRAVIAKINILLKLIKKAKIQKNHGQLQRFSVQLRNLIKELKKTDIKPKVHINKKKIEINTIQNQAMFSIRWGQVQPAGSGSDTSSESWDGTVTVTDGKINLINPILFEDNDEIISEDAELIEFDSTIARHIDGLLIKVFPDEDGSFGNTVVTVSFDDQDGISFSKGDFKTKNYKENIDEDGKGVVIERKKAGRVNPVLLDNFNEDIQDDFEEFFSDLDEDIQDEIGGFMSELDGDLQEDFLLKRKKFRTNLDKMMKFLPYMPVEKRDDMLEYKLSILEEVENLDALINTLDSVSESSLDILKNLKGQVEAYNFDPNTAETVQMLLQEFIQEIETGDKTDTEIEAGIEELQTKIEENINQSKGRKYTQGLIPFKDTDDDQWFATYVSYVKDKGIVSGYNDASGNALGEFRPANNVTIAEILKMALETADIGGDESGTPGNSKAKNHWAKKYFKQAEGLGLNMTEDDTVDPNSLATRGDVIRLALEALGIDPGTVSSVDFSDVSRLDPNAPFIQYAKEAGVISGDTGKTTFRPNESVNRAEVAKIMQNMVEILKSAADVQ